MKPVMQLCALTAVAVGSLSFDTVAQHHTYIVNGTVSNVLSPVGIWSGVQLGDPVNLVVRGYFAPFDCQGPGREQYMSTSLTANLEIGGVTSSAALIDGAIGIWNDTSEPAFPGTCGDSFSLGATAAADYDWFSVVLHDAPVFGCGDALSSCSLPESIDADDFEWFQSIVVVFDGSSSSLIEAEFGSISVEVTMNDLCNGDGGTEVGCTDCPCGNNAVPGTVGGCLNSIGSSARLRATGNPSISLPSGSTTDLRFGLSGAPPLTLSVLFSGDAAAPLSISNPCFGLNTGATSTAFDGLRCAVGNTRRSGARLTDDFGSIGVTNIAWGGSNQPAAGIGVDLGASAGETRYFQAINRDNSQLVCAQGLNTSQAVEVTFAP